MHGKTSGHVGIQFIETLVSFLNNIFRIFLKRKTKSAEHVKIPNMKKDKENKIRKYFIETCIEITLVIYTSMYIQSTTQVLVLENLILIGLVSHIRDTASYDTVNGMLEAE